MASECSKAGSKKGEKKSSVQSDPSEANVQGSASEQMQETEEGSTEASDVQDGGGNPCGDGSLGADAAGSEADGVAEESQEAFEIVDGSRVLDFSEAPVENGDICLEDDREGECEVVSASD